MRSLSLTKAKKEGRAPIGSVLGSLCRPPRRRHARKPGASGLPAGRTDLLGAAREDARGAASGVARIGGKLERVRIDADINVTPVRILGAPFGGSDLHVAMTQNPSPAEGRSGRRRAARQSIAPFNKEAYLKDTSSQGEYTRLGRALRRPGAARRRGRDPAEGADRHGKGRRSSASTSGPIGKMLTADEDPERGPSRAARRRDHRATSSLERIATSDLAHAKARFAPKTLRVNRGGQTNRAPRQGGASFALADDTLTIPKVTFDLAAPNGFKGAFAVNGTVKKVTRGGELGLEAELSPIDLGILVGVVPRMTRAVGTLSGSVKVRASPPSPNLDGRLKVRGGEFGIKGLPGGITDVEVDVEADENEARITRAVGPFPRRRRRA